MHKIQGKIPYNIKKLRYRKTDIYEPGLKKIINSNKPKKRYLVGYGARSMLFIRKWFGDNFYEFILKIIGLRG